jgi:hypothetical protein
LEEIDNLLSSMTRPALTLLTLLLAFAGTANAQWTQLPSVAIGGVSNFGFGGMAFKDGNLLIGVANALWRSTDLGNTWSRSTSTPFAQIAEIVFYDKNIGLVADGAAIYLTQDAGSTWRSIIAESSRSIGFAGSPDMIVVGGESVLDVSSDRGVTWVHRTYPEEWMHELVVKGTTIYTIGSKMAGGGDSPTRVLISTDLGVSWVSGPPVIDYDTYSFSVDSSDGDRLYLPNEDAAMTLDGQSQLYVSTDRGQSFTTSRTAPIDFLCGSIAVTPCAVFVPTVTTDGVLRSTNKGASWEWIGGPPGPVDTRLLCAADANTLFAVDLGGKVWRTLNSGGKTIGGTEPIFPDTLDFSDPIATCGPAGLRSFVIATCGSLPSILYKLSGSDSAYFAVRTYSDSVAVTFQPDSARQYHGVLEVYIADTLAKRIAVESKGKPMDIVTLRTSSVAQDTIGADVFVPLTVRDLVMIGNTLIEGSMTDLQVSATIHFDPTVLQYRSAEAADDPRDLTRNTTPTSARAVFGYARPDSLLGFYRFQAFPLRSSCVPVYIDSIEIRQSGADCFRLDTSLTASVCFTTDDCLAPIVSPFVRYGALPMFKAYPNPASSSLHLDVSRDIQGAAVRVTNELGREVANWRGDLIAGKPISIDLTGVPEGVLFIEINGADRPLLTGNVLHSFDSNR